MKLIYTLLFLSVSFVSLGQLADISDVTVTAKCTPRTKQDTARSPLEKGLTGSVSGLNVAIVNQGVFSDAGFRLRCIGTPLRDIKAGPLLVIDGIPFPSLLISELDSTKIKQIDTLNEATGTAIYGTDGVNGAICVTMKKQGLSDKGDDSKPQTINNGVFSNNRIRSCGGSKFRDENHPILVVDGLPVPLGFINYLNPNDIESIDIFNIRTATTIFGPDGADGAIIVVMKKTVTIKDFINGNPVAGATVSFISANKTDTLSFVANESGIVTISKLKPGVDYSIRVSSIGYKTLQQDFVNTSKNYLRNILLSREVKECEKVVLSSVVCSRWIRCGGLTKVIRDKYEAEKNMTSIRALTKIYPNPISKGAAISCQWKDMEDTVTELRLVSLDGKTLLRQTVTNKGNTGLVQLYTDTRWAAGIYFLQIICEKGRVLASEKVIIQ